MADYTNSKNGLGAVFPDGGVASDWKRSEPLITAEQLRSFHLFGIPLVSAIRDPINGKAMIMTDPLLAQYIIRAVALAEADTGLEIFPVQFEEKHPFDKHLYDSFGFFNVFHRPVASIQALTVCPSNDVDVYNVPLDWVETGNLHKGQINIIPLTIALTNGSMTPPQAAGGAVFLSIFGHKPWVPALWKIKYTTGFPDGMIPRLVNELIGTIAAMEVLSMLATTYARNTSTSLGIDGMSQSIGTPGPQLFRVRMEELGDKRQRLVGKLKAMYGTKLFSGNV